MHTCDTDVVLHAYTQGSCLVHAGLPALPGLVSTAKARAETCLNLVANCTEAGFTDLASYLVRLFSFKTYLLPLHYADPRCM